MSSMGYHADVMNKKKKLNFLKAKNGEKLVFFSKPPQNTKTDAQFIPDLAVNYFPFKILIFAKK